jgi:hypothetical protein
VTLFATRLSFNTTTTIPDPPDTSSYLGKGSSSKILVRLMINYIDCRQNEQSQAATESSYENQILEDQGNICILNYYGCYLLLLLKSATEDFLIKDKSNTIVTTTSQPLKVVKKNNTVSVTQKRSSKFSRD